MVEDLKCPHGNYMVRTRGNTTSFGLPKCCRKEMTSPAEGEGFIIVGKVIHNSFDCEHTLIDKED